MALACLLIFIQSTLAAQIACTRDYYGSPSPTECDELLASLPNDDRPRLFDEEQMRTRCGLDFPGVKNPYPNQVFQVPAYWSLSMCHQ